MNGPTPVQIVRPYFTRSERWARVVTRTGLAFADAAFLMLLIPVVAPWHPGYWEAFAGLLAWRIIQSPHVTLDEWSKKGSKPKAATS